MIRKAWGIYRAWRNLGNTRRESLGAAWGWYAYMRRHGTPPYSDGEIPF